MTALTDRISSAASMAFADGVSPALRTLPCPFRTGRLTALIFAYKVGFSPLIKK
jgi:hypothetical protein